MFEMFSKKNEVQKNAKQDDQFVDRNEMGEEGLLIGQAISVGEMELNGSANVFRRPRGCRATRLNG